VAINEASRCRFTPFRVARTNPPVADPAPINWRRGVFRIWLLISAGWVMSWVIYLIMRAFEGGYAKAEIFVVTTLLFGPPVALLVFGVATGWAFRGFQVDDRTPKE
jgi:hypothetical protein